MAKKSKSEEFMEAYRSGDLRKGRQMLEDEKRLAASQPKGPFTTTKKNTKKKRP